MNDDAPVVERETFETAYADIAPLLDAHWEELALFKDDIPLDVDWPAYRSAYERGFIRAYGVRIGHNRRMIGYAVFQTLERHSHYAHRWAVNDVLWIAPEHRNLGVGTALCDAFEADLRAGGPIVIVIETKEHSPMLAALLRARGYLTIGPVLGKRFA
jgi:ribosomal protein S18 acetylase RimI-like enzyme